MKEVAQVAADLPPRTNAARLRGRMDVTEGPLQWAAAVVRTAAGFRIHHADDRCRGMCRMRSSEKQVGPLWKGGRASRYRGIPRLFHCRVKPGASRPKQRHALAELRLKGRPIAVQLWPTTSPSTLGDVHAGVDGALGDTQGDGADRHGEEAPERKLIERGLKGRPRGASGERR